MFTLTISFNSVAAYIVAADLILLLSYVLFIMNQKKKLERTLSRITDFVTEYFLNTGVEVLVTCFQLPNSPNFNVQIESAPLKRFRFSNILESNLISHIFRITGSKVEKIYWRFPVTPQNEAMFTEENSKLEKEDPYLSEMRAAAVEGYTVSEVAWEKD